MSKQIIDPRTGRPIGEVEPKTADSSGSGEEKFGPTPKSIADAIGKKADAEEAANTAGLLAAGERVDRDTARRTVR